MPVITVETSKVSKEQKQELVATLTKSASSIMNIPEQAFVVLINEKEQDNIGGGGKLLSEKLKSSCVNHATR